MPSHTLFSLVNLTTFLLLAFALAINIKGVLSGFDSAVYPDTLNAYIPFSKAFLLDKLAFLKDERSLHVVPMAYIYPALFGAEIEAIKIGNLILSCLSLLVLCRLGFLLHSRLAGIIVAFIYALSPILTIYKSAILTEPLFLFLTTLWLMAAAEILSGKRYFIPIAGIAYGIMVLSRGTYIYFLYIILFITLWLSFRKNTRASGQRLFIAHLLSCLFPVLVIAKNWFVFGYPILATGVGSALFFGCHPLTAGYEAPYFKLGYDIGAVTQGLNHLSIEGDKLLKGVAMLMLQQQSPWDILENFTQKTFAFIFITKAILSDTIWNLRSYRIAEVILSITGLFVIRQTLMRWIIAGALTYQIIVHIPVLYSHRYSVGALEIPLTLLAAIGVAHILTDWRGRFCPICKPINIILLIVISIFAGEWHRVYSQTLMPDILSVPHEKVYQWKKQDLTQLNGSGVINEDDGYYRIIGKQGTLDVPVPELHLSRGEEYYIFSINLTAEVMGITHKCGSGAIYYRSVEEVDFSEAKSQYFRIISDGKSHYYHVSATSGLSPLYPEKAGFLRIAINCPENSRIQLNQIQLSLSRVAQTYRNLYFHQIK